VEAGEGHAQIVARRRSAGPAGLGNAAHASHSLLQLGRN
jgi:hypothetical protein